MVGSRFVFIPVVVLAGCHYHPSNGDECGDAGYLCDGEHTGFECRDHRWVELPCRGPRGCRASSHSIACDWSADRAGEACPSGDVGAGACSRDGRTLFVCGAEGIVTSECARCTTSPDEVECLTSAGAGADAGPRPAGDAGGTDRDGEAIGDVQVLVAKAGAPQSSVNVVFHDPAGAPLAHLQTGSDGRAHAAVPAGAMVTVAFGDASEYLLWSWIGVEPGDALEFDEPATLPPEAGTAHASMPGPLAGASGYGVGSCDGTVVNPDPSAPVEMPISRACVGRSGTFALLAMAYDGSPNPRGYSIGKIAAPGPALSASLAMPPWRTDFDDFGLQVTNAAPGATHLFTRVSLFNEHVAVHDLLSRDDGAVAAGSGATFLVKVPHAGGDAIDYGVRLRWEDGESSIERLVGPQELTQSVNLSIELLPRLRQVSLDLTAEARPAVSWVADGSMQGADLGQVLIAWGAAHAWLLEVPPGTSAPVRAPTLPAALAAWRPSGADYAPPTVQFVDADAVNGWSQARRRPASASTRPSAPEMGGTSRVSVGGAH